MDFVDVLRAIVEDAALAIFLPVAFADVLRHCALVDALPAFDPVGFACIRQALAHFIAGSVRVIRSKTLFDAR